jgi:hypothetical protein
VSDHANDVIQVIRSLMDLDKTIIAASPIMIEPGSDPSRMVIRDMDYQYVVHMQSASLPPGYAEAKPYFTSGDYYSKSEPNALMNAWDTFAARTRFLHHWKLKYQ